jgi:NitT/TauT family transport system substrate-binding protein
MKFATWSGSAALVVAFAMATHAAGVAAELAKVTIARQDGIQYLPLMIMQQQKLLEKHAKARGAEVTVEWIRFAGGNDMNDAILSDRAQFGTAGVPPFITLWARTRGNADVKAVAAVSSYSQYLVTRNPDVRTLRDLTERDRIALPGVKVSMSAVVLQMAAAQAFGAESWAKLDPLTVSMSFPDATVAMLAGKGPVDSHVTALPFVYEELKDPHIHTVLNFRDVIGLATSIVAFTTSKFRTDNPTLFGAFLDGLREAQDFIARDRKSAAAIYLQIANDKRSSVDDIVKMLNDPDVTFKAAPFNTMKYVDFMYHKGSIKVLPGSWKDLFFPNIHQLAGS